MDIFILKTGDILFTKEKKNLTLSDIMGLLFAIGKTIVLCNLNLT